MISLRRTAALAFAIATIFCLSSGSALASGAKNVMVYPLVAPSSELRIYSRPIADVLAKGLGKALGVTVSVSADSGDAPKGVDLLVDGSIHKEKRGIALEARIRDPASGRVVGAASAKIRPLEDLELSASELVKKLAPIASKWRKAERPRAATRLKGSVLEVEVENVEDKGARTTDQSGATTDPKAVRSPTPERRPLFVIPRAGGNAAGGAVRVDSDATEATYAFAERLGASYEVSSATGSDEALALANAVRDSGALYALAVYLREVQFNYRGVLSARGSAVIRLIDRNGNVVMQKNVSTDTVVGSRGDRHTALIYAVVEQCLDIALPDLKKALTK